MSGVARLTAIGAGSIIAFDALASVASRTIGFPYSYATFGSWATF